MDPKTLAGITVYDDLATILEERGFADAQIAEIITKLSAQAEMEVVEEIMAKLTDEQLQLLDNLPANHSAFELAETLGLDGEEIDVIRAEKVAKLIEELVPEIDKDDEEVEETPQTSQ